ncbi:MAG: threonine--tRNA ligase [Clostridiales Family XIII bacterium]|jgi:threonyl-tRNA synthetase|nr:threonine--tRNA ligase [Clostridiales Family XIII bacterium]
MPNETLDFHNDPEAREAYRHTASHIMAQAVKRLWPDAKLAIGPAIEDGFYYDFDLEHKLTEEDFRAIEKEIKKILKANYPLERRELSREDALKWADDSGEPYKRELIEALPEGEAISFYEQGEFTDLCRGPHLAFTGQVKAEKLMSVAGSYWRGDSNNKMLQRIYGTAWPSREELDAYIARIEEAKKRDHRRIGKEMGLFILHEDGPGFPFFLPNGMIIRNELERFWRDEHAKRGYAEIRTPLILNEELWHTSGHWDHYKENMYFTKIDEADYAIKPMNCPGAMLVYANRMYSYRDLPVRFAELGQVHRHEMSGVLHGLMRVRTFTQDDGHIFMLPEQTEDEIIRVIEFTDYIYKLFGFDYRVEISTKPEDSMGSEEDWDRATAALVSAAEKKGVEYVVNEGDGAFYGPKIDFHLRDSIGRTWQCGTIQLDFQMPGRFGVTYVGADGNRHVPYLIHRAIFGSIERFIGILTEHFAGKFPLWLAPVQLKVLTVTEQYNPFAGNLAKRFEDAGLRVKVDGRNEKIGYKIREARNARDSYIVVVGEKEANGAVLPVRSSKEGELGEFTTDALIAKLTAEVASKAV